MIDVKSQLFWTRLVGCGSGFVGFGIGHTLAPFRDPAIDTLTFLAGLAFWGIGIVGVKYGRALAAAPAVALAEEPRRIPDLGQNGWVMLRDGVTLEQTAHKVELRDPRLQQWAFAIAYNNAKMTQAKWAGRKRLFSKPEYERWIACLLEKEIVTFANPRNPAGGYKPNGARGWQTIKNLADKRDYIPLPTAVMSEAGVRFVSARMSERAGAGEG